VTQVVPAETAYCGISTLAVVVTLDLPGPQVQLDAAQEILVRGALLRHRFARHCADVGRLLL
jgi:hypothetical protein